LKNVLNIITSIHDGGLERHVYYILSFKQNKDLNHSVAVLTKRRENELTIKYENLGISIKYFDFDNRLHDYGSITKNIFQLFKLAGYINKMDADVIHSHDFFPALVSRLAAIMAFVFYFHRVKRLFITLHIVFFWLKPLHNRINKILSYFTTRIICLSKAIQNYSIEHDRIKPGKYCIINTGVDTSRFVPVESMRFKYLYEFGFDKTNIVLGNIGVLSIRKGQIYLLKAFNVLKNDFPNLRLLIIGGEREHESDIKEEIYDYIRSNDLENNVKIISPREDINLVYNLFDIFVMPSITEGLSACAIEAMLMEKICLFSDIDPFKELVEDGVNGFLFRNRDVLDLTKKLKFIVKKYKCFDAIKKEARKSVMGKFDVRLMVDKYENLYFS